MGSGAPAGEQAPSAEVTKIPPGLADLPQEKLKEICGALQLLSSIGLHEVSDIVGWISILQEKLQTLPTEQKAVSAGGPEAPAKVIDPYTAVFEKLGGDAVVREHAFGPLLLEDEPALDGKQDKIFQSLGFDNMRKCAQHSMNIFKETLTVVQEKASSSGIKIEIATNMKGSKRGNVKARVTYGNDASLVSDVVRATIIVDGGIGDLYTTLKLLSDMDTFSQSIIKVIGFEDRFIKPMPGGYRDLQLILRVCYLACELQLNLKSLVLIKESAEGHGVYEDVRLRNDNTLLAGMEDDFVELQSNIRLGANPNSRERKYGITVLHYSACYGNLKGVQLLLESKADPLKLDNFGFLPIQRAVHNGHFQVCGCLLDVMETFTNLGAPMNVPSLDARRNVGHACGMLVDLGQQPLAVRLETWCHGAWKAIAVTDIAAAARGSTLNAMWANEALRSQFFISKDFLAWSKEHGVAWVLGLVKHESLSRHILKQIVGGGDVGVCVNLVRLMARHRDMIDVSWDILEELLGKASVTIRKSAFKLLKIVESTGAVLPPNLKEAMQKCTVDPHLMLWLQAEDIIGSIVSEWPDMSNFTSSEKRCLKQEDDMLRPVKRPADLNGHDVVGFNNGQHLTFSSNYVTVEDGMGLVVFVVFSDLAGTNVNSFLFDQGHMGNRCFGLRISQGAGGIATPAENGGVFSTITWKRLPPGGHVVAFNVVFSSHMILEIDGAEIAKIPIKLPSLSSEFMNLMPTRKPGGGPFTLGSQSKTYSESGAQGRTFSGSIAELRIYKRPFDDDERKAMVQELAQLYDLTLSSPDEFEVLQQK